ncbi:MazG nucleotide pyrophosphohydrolase domain-containing protein, partial [Enterococcus casseliflavus]|uniref:MazG nucleotide pyrophosphohydrolase domain-containing protein n=1 Tax=Enterococcus casseliflavus TaxID=37734 RepID=UPI002954801E
RPRVEARGFFVSYATRTKLTKVNKQEGLPEEKLANLTEELGDVLDNLFILADKYDISLETIMQKHKEKLLSRYQMDHMTEKNS